MEERKEGRKEGRTVGREGSKKCKLKDTMFYSIGLIAGILYTNPAMNSLLSSAILGDSQKKPNNN